MAHVFEEKWRSQDVRLRENVDFSALLLSERLLAGLKNAGFRKPSPIQLESIPMGRFGKDLMVQAKSGTGKTLVFVIVALEMLKRKLFRPQVMVIVPTREIATQICSVVKAVGCTFPKLACNSFIGGLPLFEDKEKAVMSQIVVGTPGRLKQLIQLKALPTNSIRLLVFDEADELLEGTSFKDDIDDIFNSLPDDKQVIATSATFSPRTKKALLHFLRDPHLVRLNAKELALLGMVHYVEVVEFCPMPVLQYNFKLAVLEKILKTVKFGQCLLFCNGIQRVEVLYKDIKKWGFSTAYISSAKEQCDRLKAIDRLKHFKCKVLVSSDLTARGIDAENVDLVINFDLSYFTESYMHRVGRAGRYGTVGVAISIICDNETKHLKRIEKEGSFKAFKLPDPIPKDLILYPPEGDYIINESDPENVDSSEVEKCIECSDVLNNNDYDSEKEMSTKNVEVKGVSVTSTDIGNNACENSLSEPANQPTADDIKSHDDITKCILEYKKADEVDEHDIAHSENESIKTIHFNEEITDQRLQNGYINGNCGKLDENKNSDLLNDCDQSEFINSESTDKPVACDISKNINDLCDENVIEKQDTVNDNIDEDTQLSTQFPNINDNLKNNDFGTDSKNLSEKCIDNLPESFEKEDSVEKTEDDSVNCEQESGNKSSSTLNAIKAFIDTYETMNKGQSMKSNIAFAEDSQLMENSDKKLITIDMINSLKSQKNEFFYKTFKKFQEDKDGCSTVYKNQKEDKIENSHEDFNTTPKDENNTDLVDGEINTAHEKLTENSEFETKKVFSEKPNFESTPEVIDKIKQKNVKMTAYNPTVQNKIIHLFQELSDESDCDDSDSSEVAKPNSCTDSVSDSLSSDSESDSSTSDSEEDSDSETYSSPSCSESESSSDSSSTTSSVSEGENCYHHNYFRTGRQNPSLISDSSNNRMHHDQIHTSYFQNHKCLSCCATMNGMPLQNTARSQERPRKMNRGRKRKVVDQKDFETFNPRESALYFKRFFEDIFWPSDNRRDSTCSGGDFQAAAKREQSFADGNVTQSRDHSRRRRSKNSSRSTTREEDQNRSQNPIHRRTHCHTLGCFLPTEHRCHPNTPDYPCTQGSICEMWYKTFYNQWLHIQNVIN